MSGAYDQEMEKLQKTANVQALATALGQSKKFAGLGSCKLSGRDTLEVSIKGQVVGVWKEDLPNLLLFRPGADRPDSTVTSVTEAAVMTARLVAASGQA
jgi:hypothetical protein